MSTRLPSSIVLSIVLHVLVAFIVGSAFVSCTSSTTRIAETPAKAIDATVVSEEQANSYYERKRIIEEQRQRKEEEKKATERKRRALERGKKRKAEEKKRKEEQFRAQKRKEEKLRLEKARAEKEKQRKMQEEAETRKKALEEEQKRKQEELKRATEESLAREEAKRREAEQQRLLKMRKQQIGQWTRQYIGTLRRSIEAQWKKPPASIKGGDCVVKVQQKEDGTVVSAEIITCGGDKLYQRSVIEAVWRANPLPLPPAKDVFDSEIQLTFRKEYGR